MLSTEEPLPKQLLLDLFRRIFVMFSTEKLLPKQLLGRHDRCAPERREQQAAVHQDWILQGERLSPLSLSLSGCRVWQISQLFKF